MVDGRRSNLVKVDVVSGVSQGSVSGPLFFLLYTLELFSMIENKLYRNGYANDSTLVAIVPSPLDRIAVAESRIVVSAELLSGVTFGE